MNGERDPVEAENDGSHDLYDIATWEPRTWLDRLAVRTHALLRSHGRYVLAAFALLVVLAQFAIVGAAILSNPVIGVFAFLSVVPALGIAVYVWRADVTRPEPLGKLLVTFLLGFLFAGFAGIVNTILGSYFELIPVVGFALFFFLVVAPIEEFVKWLAVRLYAYPSDEFTSVVDGAVYGAIAGLGFATIENAIYIGGEYLQAVRVGVPEGELGALVGIAAVRTFAGPGHVLYSAIAGYYLGLARFNPDHRGPIVVKGLLLAAGTHAVYNTAVTSLPAAVETLDLPLSTLGVFLVFVVVYDGVIAYFLLRKLRQYRAAYVSTGAGETAATATDDGVSDPDADPD